MKKGAQFPPGVRETVIRLAGSRPRPTNREIRKAIEMEFEVEVSYRTIGRYCKAAGVPTSSQLTRSRSAAGEGLPSGGLPLWIAANYGDATRAIEAYVQALGARARLVGGATFIVPGVVYGPHEKAIIENIRRNDGRLASLERHFHQAEVDGDREKAEELVLRIKTVLEEWLVL